MKKLRKFLEDRKIERAFSSAGRGYSLTSDTRKKEVDGRREISVPGGPAEIRRGPQDPNVAAAALERADKVVDPAKINRSAQAIKRMAKKRAEEQKKREEEEYQKAMRLKEHYFGPEVEVEITEMQAQMGGIFFECPDLLPNLILPERQLLNKIEETLKDFAEVEPIISNWLLFLTLNTDKAKLEDGKNLVNRYLKNIIENPGDEKYKRIKLSNKVYQSKLAPLKYAQDVLIQMGFEIVKDEKDGERYLVFNGKNDLGAILEVLETTAPLKICLNRDMKVSRSLKDLDDAMPSDSLFRLSIDDWKTIQSINKDNMEKEEMLRTQAMKARDDRQDSKKYAYSLIRIQFPNHIFIQGTFSAKEPVSSIVEFVRENLKSPDTKFLLVSPVLKISSFDPIMTSIGQNFLAPSAMFHFNPEVIGAPQTEFLNEKCMLLLS